MRRIEKIKSKLKLLVTNIILLLVVVLIMFFLIDFVINLTQPKFKEIHDYDDDYLHNLIPNSNKLKIMSPVDGGDIINIKINEDGFRGNSFNLKNNITRIMVYGDSFIEGEFSQLNFTFVKRLEYFLNKNNNSHEVLNAGVVGYGPDQASLRIKNEYNKFKPDIIILSLFVGNDYGDLIRNKLYRIKDGDLLENDVKLNKFNSFKRSAVIKFPSLNLYYRGFLKIKSLFVKSEAYSVMDSLDVNLDDCESYYLNNDVDSVFEDTMDVDVVLNRNTTCSSDKLNLMFRIVNELDNIAEVNDFEFIVMIIPSKEMVDDSLFDKSDLPDNFNKTYLTDITETMFNDAGVKNINLYPYLRENNLNNSFYFKLDSHWNNDGQNYSAYIISEELKKKLYKK